MPPYKTKDGDMLDAICDELYGNSDAALTMVMEANVGLPYLPTVLEAGLTIELPAAPEEEAAREATVALWD